MEEINLIKTWKVGITKNAPYFLKGDDILVNDKRRVHEYRNYQDYLNDKNFGFNDVGQLHLGLVPVPYLGDLKNAKIFIAMLNPGFEVGDYYSEYVDQDIKKMAWQNLRQEIKRDDYPLYFLNPKYLWTGGGRYWSNKLKDLIGFLKDNNYNYQEALNLLSNSIAILELVPYSSKTFNLPDNIIKQLHSTQIMLDYIKNDLVARSKAGEICLIIARGARFYDNDIKEDENIIIYDNKEARSANLSFESRGGKKMREFLSENSLKK